MWFCAIFVFYASFFLIACVEVAISTRGLFEHVWDDVNLHDYLGNVQRFYAEIAARFTRATWRRILREKSEERQ